MARRKSNNGERPNIEELGEELISATNGLFAESLNRRRMALGKGCETLHDEMVRFINHRLECDSDVLKKYQQCESIIDVLALQQKWFIEFSQDYYRESMKLAGAIREIAANGSAEIAHVTPSLPSQHGEMS